MTRRERAGASRRGLWPQPGPCHVVLASRTRCFARAFCTSPFVPTFHLPRPVHCDPVSVLASRQVLLLLFPFSISGLSLTRSALGSLPLALSLGSLVVPGSQGARQQAGGAPATHAPFPQVWQHCDCMGVHADVEHYLCERCEPRPVDRVSRPLRPAAGALAPFDAALSPPPASVSPHCVEGRGPWAQRRHTRPTFSSAAGSPCTEQPVRPWALSRAAFREGRRLCDSPTVLCGLLSRLCPVHTCGTGHVAAVRAAPSEWTARRPEGRAAERWSPGPGAPVPEPPQSWRPSPLRAQHMPSRCRGAAAWLVPPPPVRATRPVRFVLCLHFPKCQSPGAFVFFMPVMSA